MRESKRLSAQLNDYNKSSTAHRKWAEFVKRKSLIFVILHNHFKGIIDCSLYDTNQTKIKDKSHVKKAVTPLKQLQSDLYEEGGKHLSNQYITALLFPQKVTLQKNSEV